MEEFRNTIIKIYGKRAEVWLKKLPSLLKERCDRYGISELTPVKNLSYNYVAKGKMAGKDVIVKTGLNHQALSREASCLTDLKSDSLVKLIKREEDILILEALTPGTTLKDLYIKDETKATHILCAVVADLQKHQACPYKHSYKHYPTLADLLTKLDEPFNLPKAVVEKAKALGNNLLASSDRKVLLHGDLHHENVLLSENGWKAIDPMGYIGDPIYEVCAYVLNPFPVLIEFPKAKELIDARIELIAKTLKFNEQRVRDWVFIKNVICWIWSIEDNLSTTYNEQLASLMAK